MADLRMGIYRHYKGALYQVLGLAHDANDETRKCVVYIGLQLDPSHLGPRLAVRTLSDFEALLPGMKPRFAYLGPELTVDMLRPFSNDYGATDTYYCPRCDSDHDRDEYERCKALGWPSHNGG